MEKEKNMQPQEMAYKYLLAHFQYTAWLSDEYKNLAKQNSSPEVLRELYLCASDKIPLERIKEALQRTDAASALSKTRHQYWEESVTKEYKKELNELQKRIKDAETTIAAQEYKLKNVPKFGTTENLEVKSTDEVQSAPSTSNTFREKWRLFWKKGTSVKVFLEEIVNSYDTKQLNFIMNCIEEGIPIEVIKTFISPVLPVEVMTRLKRMKWKDTRKPSIRETIEKNQNLVQVEQEGK